MPDPASAQLNDSDRLLLFPFRWNTEAVDSNHTTVRAVVYNCTRDRMSLCRSPQMKVAWIYLYFGTDFELMSFVPTFLVIIEWRNLTFPCCLEQVHPFPYTHAHIHASQM